MNLKMNLKYVGNVKITKRNVKLFKNSKTENNLRKLLVITRSKKIILYLYYIENRIKISEIIIIHIYKTQNKI